MCSSIILLLLFCLIKYSGTPPVSVTGKRGENVTLTCDSEDREITRMVLSRLSKKILVCEKEECESVNGRVCKEGSCDVVIKDLIYSDAGKYILNVHHSKDQTLDYHLHIHDEILGKKGEDLKLDVLLANADKVERDSRSGWKELWTRGHGVSSDRLTVSDQTLIIHEFTVTDTGTHRALDYEENILITVTVTESSAGSTETQDSDDDHKPNEQRKHWTIVPSVCGALVAFLVVLVGVIVFHQETPAQIPEQEH